MALMNGSGGAVCLACCTTLAYAVAVHQMETAPITPELREAARRNMAPEDRAARIEEAR